MKSLEPRTVWIVASEEGVSAVLTELEAWANQQTWDPVAVKLNEQWRNIIGELGKCRIMIKPFEKTLRELRKEGMTT